MEEECLNHNGNETTKKIAKAKAPIHNHHQITKKQLLCDCNKQNFSFAV